MAFEQLQTFFAVISGVRCAARIQYGETFRAVVVLFAVLQNPYFNTFKDKTELVFSLLWDLPKLPGYAISQSVK